MLCILWFYVDNRFMCFVAFYCLFSIEVIDVGGEREWDGS